VFGPPGPTLSHSEAWTDEDRERFAILEVSWTRNGVLFRADWDKASTSVKRRFVLDVSSAPWPASDARKTPSPPMFDDSSEKQAEGTVQDAGGERGAE
jgi:hypothetical protein